MVNKTLLEDRAEEMKNIMSPFKRLSSKKDVSVMSPTSPQTPFREDLQKLKQEDSSTTDMASTPSSTTRPQSERLPTRSLMKSLFGRSKSTTILSENHRGTTPPMTPTTATTTKEVSVELFRHTNLSPEYVVFGHQTYNFVYDEKHWDGTEVEKTTTTMISEDVAVESKQPEGSTSFKKVQHADGKVSFLLQRSASEPINPKVSPSKNSTQKKKQATPKSLIERFEDENLHPEYVAFNHPRYHFIYDGRTLDEHTLIFTAMREDKMNMDYTPPRLTKRWNDDGSYFLSACNHC